jgi:hypothetical protein
MNSDFFIQAAALTVMLFGLAVLFIFIVKWKISFSNQSFDMVPSGVLDDNSAALKSLRKSIRSMLGDQEELSRNTVNEHLRIAEGLLTSDQHLRDEQKRTAQALQAALSAIRDMREETQILRSEIQKQAEELDRHRRGYDVDILKSALIPLARMHRLLSEDLARDDCAESSAETLRFLAGEVLEALEMKGVRLAFPPVGERLRDHTYIQQPPKLIETADESQAGYIARVIQPAYLLESQAATVVLLPAIAEAYFADNPIPEPPNVPPEEAVNTAPDSVADTSSRMDLGDK